MIVCLCNGLTEQEVADAIRAGGCSSVREVFAACGCLKQCGKCEREMTVLLRDLRRTQARETAAPRR